MCCSKEVVMNQKSALNKESYASCLIVGIMALLCLFPFWVAVVNSFASENSVTLSGYSIIPKELSLDYNVRQTTYRSNHTRYAIGPGIKHLFFYFAEDSRKAIPYFMLDSEVWEKIFQLVSLTHSGHYIL